MVSPCLWCMVLFLPRCRTLHLPCLNFKMFLSAQLSVPLCLLRSFWMAAQHSGVSAIPNSFASSENLERKHCIPSSKSLMNKLNNTGPSIDLCSQYASVKAGKSSISGWGKKERKTRVAESYDLILPFLTKADNIARLEAASHRPPKALCWDEMQFFSSRTSLTSNFIILTKPSALIVTSETEKLHIHHGTELARGHLLPNKKLFWRAADKTCSILLVLHLCKAGR